MNTTRRHWLSGLLAAGTVALLPAKLWAATRTAFEAKKTEAVLSSLFGDRPVEETDAIEFKIPDIAENGAVVPVTVSTDLPNVQEVSIVIDENPTPLSATFSFTPDAFVDISTRVKMGNSSMVRVFVQTPDRVYTTAKEVKVTIGGCGG